MSGVEWIEVIRMGRFDLFMFLCLVEHRSP